jgi:hypothetical protein
MSLEQFLDPQNSWRIPQAHELISHACYIITRLEKGEYHDLCDFLKKKESYLELLKELNVLVDKYNLKMPNYSFCEYTDEAILSDYEPSCTKEEWISDCRIQNWCYYHDQLKHADKLVARDCNWTRCLYGED